MHVYKHFGAISNIYRNLSKYEECIYIKVQGLYKYWLRTVGAEWLLAHSVAFNGRYHAWVSFLHTT